MRMRYIRQSADPKSPFQVKTNPDTKQNEYYWRCRSSMECRRFPSGGKYPSGASNWEQLEFAVDVTNEQHRMLKIPWKHVKLSVVDHASICAKGFCGSDKGLDRSAAIKKLKKMKQKDKTFGEKCRAQLIELGLLKEKESINIEDITNGLEKMNMKTKQ